MPELVTHYQPIVELNGGRIAGFEALSRVIEPDGQTKSAAELIKKMETDHAALYSLVSITLSCVKSDLIPLFNKYSSFYVSVNVPPIVLGSGGILQLLQDLELMPYVNRLVCELTEQQALTDVGRSALEEGRRRGIAVAVDDFGTGQNCMTQLLGLDLDILKIDRSLLLPVLTNQMAARLMRGIVSLAGALRMRTVVEGVETKEQAFFLQAAGVDCGQGWLWSKALPANELEKIIQSGFKT
jgi:EAL domain-containing protein (putative c-di-GMP-specific phosphodiesterase class I)